VVKMDSGWGVVQGNCPISLASDLPERIGDVVEGNPELIKALGGSIDMNPSTSTTCESSPEPSSQPPSCDNSDDPGCGDSDPDPDPDPAPDTQCTEQTATFTVHLPLQLYGAPKSYDWPKKLSCTF